MRVKKRDLAVAKTFGEKAKRLQRTERGRFLFSEVRAALIFGPFYQEKGQQIKN